LRDGRKSSTAFIMRLHGFLLIFIPKWSSGMIEGILLYRKSFRGMQHMHHIKLILGRSSPGVQ
jgi:hypothetical protein